MIDAIRSEWIKLRTTRATVLFIGFAVIIPVIFSTLAALLTKHPQDSSSRRLFNDMVLGPCYFTGFFAGIVGALGIGQEYRHNTIRVTFTADPRRSRVLTAKLIVNTVFGLGIGLVSLLLCFGISSSILSSRNATMNFSDPGVNVSAFLGQVVLCGLFTLAGFGLCAAIRQPAAAIPILLVWPLVVESILFGIIDSATGSERATRFLPFREGFRIASNDSFDSTNGSFSRLPAGLYFGAFVAIIVAIGWVLTLRRDA